MAYVQTSDGTHLYFEDWGTGKTLLFVHGWPLSGAMWEYQMVPLTRSGFRCIAYDRRGFGRSDKPYSGYDYATLGRDTADLIAALELTDVTLIGFSMGGGEVAEVLTKHNGKRAVTRAMLISSIVPYMAKARDNPDGVDATAMQQIMEGLHNDRPGFLTEFTKQFYGVGMLTSPVSNSMLAANCEVAMMASPQATIECARSFGGTDFRAVVGRIDVPTLVIHGDGDQTVPIAATGRQAARLIPNADFKVYAGAPHGLFYTHRRELNRDIAAFASEGRIALDTAA